MNSKTALKTGFLIGISVLLGGCGSSKKMTGMKQEWMVPINYRQVETSHVDPGVGSVLVGEGKKFSILHGENGKALRTEPKDKGIGGMFKSMVKESMSLKVGGAEIFSSADRYSYAFIGFANTVMLLDYTTSTDRIRMLDMKTGKELWKSEDYQWSLARYQNLAGAAANLALRNVGMGAGAAAGASGAVLTQERFAQHLITAIPEKNAILFRTTNGLLMLDVKTGNEIWKISDFGATGIQDLRYLKGEQDLLLVTQVSRLFDKLKTNRKVMRVDLTDGTVKWDTRYEHGSGYYEGMEMAGDRLVIHYAGGQAEVMDMNNGKVVFKTHEGGASGAQRWLQSNVSDSSYTSPRVLIRDGSAFSVHTVDVKAFSKPGKQIKRYDMETGEVVWKSREFQNVINITDLYLVEDYLIANLMEADKSLIAINVGDGKIAWDVADMGKYLRTMLHKQNLYISDGELVRKINLSTGQTRKEINIKESGLGGVNKIGIHAKHLYLVGAKGVALYSINDLNKVNKWLPKGRIQNFQTVGSRLYMQTQPLLGSKTMLRVMDLTQGRSITSFEINPGLFAWFGNLRDGVYISNNGDVYLLDQDHRLTKYKIDRTASIAVAK